MQDAHLRAAFPKLLSENYHTTSPATPTYNCIAWAANRTDKWWWPPGGISGYHWPAGVPAGTTLENFIKAFESIGYQVCDDSSSEPGFEKIAIHVGADGSPTHAARQLESGAWTSKLGKAEDIEHATLTALEGGICGTVAQAMRRPR